METPEAMENLYPKPITKKDFFEFLDHSINPNHGEEGTHSVCYRRFKKRGGKAKCCYCVPHKDCKINISQEAARELLKHAKTLKPKESNQEKWEDSEVVGNIYEGLVIL